MQVLGRLLAVGEFLLADEGEAHDRGRADDLDRGILVFERGPFVVRLGDAIEQRRLGVDLGVRVAVAEIFRQQRDQPFGITRLLRRSERLDILQDRILIGSGKGGDGAQQSKRKCRQDQTATIDVHDILPIFLVERAMSQPHPGLSSRAAVRV